MPIRTFSRRHFAEMAGILLAGTALPLKLLHATEPQVVDQPYNTLTQEEEIALGKKFAQAYEKKVELLPNPSIDSYLNPMVRKLGDASQRPSWPFQIKVVNSAMVNASAIPGGLIYVQRGLLDFVKDENELAGVIAHEAGHVVARHTTNALVLDLVARSLYESVKENIFLDNDVIANVIETLGGPIVLLAQLKYSRENESEADMLGVYEMLRAGWNPTGLVRFFTRLQQNEGGSNLFTTMLSDHPASADRAEAIRQELATVSVKAPPILMSTDFTSMKATLARLPAAPRAERD